MKLFADLTQQEQLMTLHYYTSIVIEDLIEGTLEIDDSDNPEQNALKKSIEAARKHIAKMDDEAKVKYLLSVSDISSAVQEFALEFAKSTFYFRASETNALDLDYLEEEMEENLTCDDCKTKEETKNKKAMN